MQSENQYSHTSNQIKQVINYQKRPQKQERDKEDANQDENNIENKLQKYQKVSEQLDDRKAVMFKDRISQEEMEINSGEKFKDENYKQVPVIDLMSQYQQHANTNQYMSPENLQSEQFLEIQRSQSWNKQKRNQLNQKQAFSTQLQSNNFYDNMEIQNHSMFYNYYMPNYN